MNKEKITKIKFNMALDGRRLIFYPQQPIKNMQMQLRRDGIERATERWLWGSVIHLFWGRLSWEGEKTKIDNALAFRLPPFYFKTNNQPIVGRSYEGMMVTMCSWGGAYGGSVISLFGVTNRRTEKSQK